MRNATDQGFPLHGEWRLKFGEKKPRLETGVRCWRAESAPGLDLEIAHPGGPATIRVFWKRLDDDKYDARKSLTLELAPDGQFHVYHLNLAAAPEYRGLITGLALEPVAPPRAGEELALKSIILTAGGK